MTRVNDISVCFFFFLFFYLRSGCKIINVINTLIEGAEMEECPMKYVQSRLINSISFEVHTMIFKELVEISKKRKHI